MFVHLLVHAKINAKIDSTLFLVSSFYFRSKGMDFQSGGRTMSCNAPFRNLPTHDR